MNPPIPENERERMTALRSYRILDTDREPIFDAFVNLAARLTGTPMSLVSLIDEDRQWFKAAKGFTESETPREYAFCAHAIVQPDEILNVPDATRDARFADNPLVTADGGIRFYAGVPLVTDDGFALGTLCVLDNKPREIDPEALDALRELAQAVVDQIETRRANLMLLDSAATAIAHVDLVAQRIVFASRGFETLGEFTPEQLSETPIEHIFPAMTAEQWTIREQPVRTLLRHANGTTSRVELRLEQLTKQARPLLLVLADDIEKQEREQERLELLSAALEGTKDEIFVFRKTPDGRARIEYLNAAAVEGLGYNAELLLGADSSVLFSDVAQMRAAFATLDGGERTKLLTQLRRKNGSRYHFEAEFQPLRGVWGEVSRYVAIGRDVSDRVASELLIQAQNDALTRLTSIARALFTSLDAATLARNIERGVVALVEGEARLWIVAPGGYAATDDFTAQLSRPVDDPFLRETLTTELVNLSDDGFRMAAAIGKSESVRAIIDVRRRPAFSSVDAFALGLLAQFAGVALRNVLLYGELEARQGAVVELNQLKDDLIAMLAHDFKGPLTTIVGFAEVLAETAALDPDGRELLDLIVKSAMRLSGLATDTLALSRLEQNALDIAKVPVDLPAMLSEIARGAAERRAVTVTSSGSRLVAGDPDRLRQVFENLIENAIKYSPDGGDVDVAIQGDSDGVEVAVSDHGIGIPAAEVNRLFSRFGRATNARARGISGTGFGLYLVRLLVTAHGGTITVDSVENAGTTFRVRLPAVARHGGPRLLLIDPDGDSRSYAAHALRGAGDFVRVVPDVPAALAALDDEPFDIAVLHGGDDDDEALRARVAVVRVQRPFLLADLRRAIEAALSAAV